TMHARRDGGADARHRREIGLACPGDRVEVPERASEKGRAGSAEVLDAEGDQKVREGALLRRFDRSEQVVDRDLTEALEAEQVLLAQAVDVARVVDQARLAEQKH